ncbi:ABC-three component system protein [Sulfuricella sp. T08]|uniref:ABC-three component system protein n=1 Tax=Sulfuricella sp. T08 TaxID=1632857 RepID=UPI00131F33CD|nr:ABC-three component system protein [Sulfuricella sp. T08]
MEEKLSALAVRIGVRGRVNVLNLNVHAENFYVHLFNELLGLSLVNANAYDQNATAVDLVDASNKIIIQVSSTATKQKIESALSKDLSAYAGCRFKFIPIVGDASRLKKLTYTVPTGITFDPKIDIHDVTSVVREAAAMEIDDLKRVFDLVRKELGEEFGEERLETNLADIVNILSTEDLNDEPQSLQVDPFEVGRKITFNNLDSLGSLIQGYAVHYSRLDEIYTEFDLRGVNKSASVFASINSEFLKCQAAVAGIDLFFSIIRNTVEKIRNSSNFNRIPLDELELATTILVVDAFIRCKVFKNPNAYNHVAA